MKAKIHETFYEDRSKNKETFAKFKDRMIQKAIDEDLGIIGYVVAGEESPADVVPSGKGKILCKFRKREINI